MNKEEICEKIRSTYQPCHPEKIILFGSWAKGKEDSYSDIDLIFVWNTKKRFLDRLADLYDRWSLSVGVDILAYTPEEFKKMLEEKNPFLEKAIAEGIVLYEKPTH